MEILLVTLICVGVLSFFVNRCDLMAPSNIVCGVFIIGTLFAWYKRPYWQFDYSQKTTVVILCSIGFMIGGAMLANVVVSWYGKKKTVRPQIQDGYGLETEIIKNHRHWYEANTPSVGVIIIVTIFAIATSWLYYKDIYENVCQVNSSLSMKEFAQVGAAVKRLSIDGDFQFRKYNAWLQYLRKGLAYGCIFLYLNAGSESLKNHLKRSYLILPVIPFLFCCYITGIRTEFIFLIVYIVTLIGVMSLKGGKISIRQIAKVLVTALVALGILMSIWGGTYLVRHKITSLNQINNEIKKSMLNNFAVYCGGGIVELDVFLKNPPNERGVFGEHTLQNVYAKLNRMGGDFPDIGLHIYKPSKAGKLKTNIYTAFRRYIEDYGMAGNYLICLCLGGFYTAFYRLTQRKKENPLYLMAYASLAFPLFVMASEDYFFMYLVDTTPLYICGFLIASWIFLCNSDYWIQAVVKARKES